MRVLNRKLFRDLWRLRGQALAIGLVIASGAAVLIMALSTLDALRRTTDAYYERYRFAEVFASLKRAPDYLTARLGGIPGVQSVQTRITQFATLDVADFPEPVIGQLVSVPEDGQPLLNQLALRQGRWLQPHAADEVLVNEPFADAHGLRPGSRLTAILNGHRRTLTVVGVALSPEFIYALAPGSLLPDDKRFGVLWMSREALAAAYDLDGAFNAVALALTRGTTAETVIAALDEQLEPYGGVGAVARADQLSHWFVSNELAQLATLSRMLPTVFLLVAALLTHVVIGRLMATERGQIGLLKAFGYSNRSVALHYAGLVCAIAALGVVLGMVLGSALGRLNTQMYTDLFRFPLLLYEPSPRAFVLAAAACFAAALTGSLVSVRRAARLPPTEAMQPPTPPDFKHSGLHNALRWLDQPTRIILRNMVRWPVRAAATSCGVAAAVALLVLSLQWRDSMDYLASSFFFDAQRQDVMLGMTETLELGALEDVAHLPGVLAVEPMRLVAAELSFGWRRHRGTLTGTPERAVLQPVYDDRRRQELTVPAEGVLLASALAEKLQVVPGDHITVEVLEGRRGRFQLEVADVFDSYIGLYAYVRLATLNQLLQERPSVEYVSLLLDEAHERELFAELKTVPTVSAVMLRRAAVNSFHEVLVNNLMVFVTLFGTLACVLAVGVAYNSARISLAERGRELATLRVLGFTRSEVAYILLGEVFALICLGLPVGCLLGLGLAELMASAFHTELYRVPVTIDPSSYGLAVLVALAATLVAVALVERRIERLDLIEVLKTRE